MHIGLVNNYKVQFSLNIYSRAPCQHQHALVEYIFHHKCVAAVSSGVRPAPHTAQNVLLHRFCHSVQQGCAITRNCALRVTSMSNLFFVLGGCHHAKEKYVIAARFFFTNSVLNCHDALCLKHTNVISIAEPASFRH